MLSIFGHLVLIAIMTASVFFVYKRANLVTPDRVEITEIDLANVQVTAADTKLFNTSQAQSDSEPTPEKPKTEKAILPDKEIKSTEFAENEKKDVPEKQKPIEKTTVKVNREVLSLDRTMTVSVVDALRVALTRCWVIDTNRSGLDGLRVVAHLTMFDTGVVSDVWFESESRAETDSDFAYVLETIKSAIQTCQPFRMLPRSEFEHWEKIQLVFYPTQGKIL